jgi:hypothetical protein
MPDPLRLVLFALAFGTGLPALAEVPAVVAASATPQASGWRIDVTIRHPDTGWDHYADGWEVLAPDGSRLGYRELVHPHEDEQPFTRSLSGIAVPAGADHLLIRPHCLVDGWSGTTFRLDLPG